MKITTVGIDLAKKCSRRQGCANDNEQFAAIVHSLPVAAIMPNRAEGNRLSDSKAKL